MAQLRIGSRPSRLAMAQAQIVKSTIERSAPGLACEIVPIKTTGDKLTTPSLAAVGGKGLFVRELEQALDAGRIDIAVHSMKDLPARLNPEFRLIAVPAREDTADVLMSRGPDLTGLKTGARIGTASPRRRFQAIRLRPDLDVQPLRGNIDTRIAKLRAGDFDAIILAAAGLRRMGQPDLPPLYRLPEDDFVPAGGQGALAIEAMADTALCDSAELEDAISAMDNRKARIEITAERAFLAEIGASCASPAYDSRNAVQPRRSPIDDRLASRRGHIGGRASGARRRRISAKDASKRRRRTDRQPDVSSFSSLSHNFSWQRVRVRVTDTPQASTSAAPHSQCHPKAKST
jgi:hydroxymethylbilane synthase